MNYRQRIAFSILALLALSITAAAQSSVDEARLTFTRSGQPGSVAVSIISGSIAVTGHDGTEVIVTARVRGSEQPRQRGERWVVPNTTTGLKVVEADNIVTVSVSPPTQAVDLEILVPRQTSLKLKTVNMGDITVQGTSGEFEIGNVNGAITLSDVSGSVVCQTTNGHVHADLRGLDARRPLALSTFNGDIDLTLPANTQANVALKTRYGSIISEFNLALEAGSPEVEETKNPEGTRYRLKAEGTLRGTIGRGGMGIELRTFNGDIILRRSR